MIPDWTGRHDKLNVTFESGAVFNAPEDELLEHLKTLCTGNIPNDTIRYRETIRGLTINHIQIRRLIDRLDHQNQKITKWFIILAVASLVSSVIQIALQVAGR